MPKSDFSRALSAKQREAKLSTAALAKAIGVGVQSVTAALKGTSVPNASTAAKYAKFLGVEVSALKQLTGKPVAASAKPAKPTKSAKGKAAKGKASKAKPAKAAKAAKAAKSDEFDISDLTIGEIASMFSDPLAVSVAYAPADKRRIIEAILMA